MPRWEELPEDDRQRIVRGMKYQLRRIATDLNLSALAAVGAKKAATFGAELEAELKALDSEG